MNMVNKYNKWPRLVVLLAMLLGVGLWQNDVHAQNCTIKPASSSGEGCAGGLASFSIEDSGLPIGNVDSVRWTFGAQTSSSNSPSFPLTTPGTVPVSVNVYRNGVLYCTATLNFVVNPLPVSDFQNLSNTIQCYKNNRFVFADRSTPGTGNTIVSRTLLFGDGGADSVSGFGANIGYTYGSQFGGTYTVTQRVIDNKGCVDDESKPAYVEVIPDLDLNFVVNVAAGCGTTTAPIANISAIPFNRVTYFRWDFGDGESYEMDNGRRNAVDQCFWNPTHVYSEHGCFDIRLIVEDDKGCRDTFERKGAVCNIKPVIDIQEASGRDGQCHAGNSFVFSHNIQTFNFPVQFLWMFDDPPSGTRNIDNQNFNNAPHDFQDAPRTFRVTLTGRIANCPFDGAFDVITKGPAASIESKAIPDLVADTQRHQCQIKDTVYFTNNSSFYINDKYILDDPAPGATQVYKRDTAFMLRTVPNLRIDTVENFLDTFFWYGDTFWVVGAPLQNPTVSGPLVDRFLLKHNDFAGAIGGQRRADNVRMVWDFGDNVAPQCTTWTKYMQNVWDFNKPVYVWFDSGYVDPITNVKGYYKFIRGNAARALEPDQSKFIDTTYEWMNCNFSRDPIPKHWYTPGEEGCKTVRLVMKDTTFDQPGGGFDYSIFERRYENSNVLRDSGGVFNYEKVRFLREFEIDTVKVFPPLLDANGDTVWIFNQFCAADTIGFRRDLTKAPVSVSTVQVPNRWWPNPNKSAPDPKHQDECESTSTLMLALMPPKATGMRWTGVPCYGPAPPYGLTFDWSRSEPGCTQEFVWVHYDSLADRVDNSPNVFNLWQPQNSLLVPGPPGTPWPMATMNLPTWPTSSFRNYPVGSIADPCGWVTTGLRIMNGIDPRSKQPCIDERWYHKFVRYVPNDPRFTMNKNVGCNPMEIDVSLVNDIHDSLESMTFTFRNTDPNKIFDIFSEVDSVFRNKLDPRTGNLVNYIITYRVNALGQGTKIDSVSFVPGVGGVQNACSNELRLKKTRTVLFEDQGRYAVTVTATNVVGCQFARTEYVVIGFFKEAWADNNIICKGEAVNFYDTSLYYLLEPDPATGDIFLRYNYWKRPARDFQPNGDPRALPLNQRERVRWDFAQGQGWITFGGSPTPSPVTVGYPVPGYYNVRAEYTDSIGCSDTVFIPINVTGVSADFAFSVSLDDCKPLVQFNDSSRMFDPCWINDGVRCDSVVRWIWDFGDGSPVINTTSINAIAPPIRNPAHLYRGGFGDYDVKLIVQTANGCWDTIMRTVSIEGPRPRFEFAIDSVGCAPYTAYFRNLSIDPSPNASWTWIFGNNQLLTTREDTTVFVTYNTPGTYRISLIQEDVVPQFGINCKDSFPKAPRTMEVRVLPQRKVDFTASKLEVCPNEVITFTDSSDAIYDNFEWIFGDGDTLVRSAAQGGKQVTHSYGQTGSYVVRLRPTYTPTGNDPRCIESKSILIIVRDLTASFTVDSSNMPIFRFTNTTQNGQNYWWNFGDGNGYIPCPQVDPVNCPNAQHDYRDQLGEFEVCLIAQSPEGCFDTTCKIIRNNFEVSIRIPNIFTPNGDGINDEFEVEIKGWAKYEIEIFNRMGDKVFESNDPAVRWNGKRFNDGAECAAGVYYVNIVYQLRGQQEQTYNGTVTLMRKQ